MDWEEYIRQKGQQMANAMGGGTFNAPNSPVPTPNATLPQVADYARQNISTPDPTTLARQAALQKMASPVPMQEAETRLRHQHDDDLAEAAMRSQEQEQPPARERFRKLAEQIQAPRDVTDEDQEKILQHDDDEDDRPQRERAGTAEGNYGS